MSADSATVTGVLDPEDIDWRELFREHTGSVGGKLGLVDRVKAVKSFTQISNDDYAETLIGDAIEAGILERDQDYIYIASEGGDQNTEASAEDVDWEAVFRGAAGSESGKISTQMLPDYINVYDDAVDTSTEAEQLKEEALEKGIIEIRDGPEGQGTYLVDALVDSEDADVGASASESGQEQEVPEEIQALREQSSTQDEYVRALEGVVGELMKRVERVEQRQNTLFDENRRQRTGLTEMQVNRLKQGAILSRDGVDEEALRQDLGLDIIIVGENSDMIRLADRHQAESNDDVRQTSLPDFDSLCDIEEVRMKNVLGMRDRDEIESESKDLYRAMSVWEDAEILDVTDNSSKIAIPSSKVREKCERIAPDDDGISSSSFYTIAGRVMELLEEKSDGVLEVEEGTENRLVGDIEELTEAKVARFQRSTIDSADGSGSSNTVVRERQGVSVRDTGR